MQEIGRIFLMIGFILILFGLLLMGNSDVFSWFGNLPGDIKIEKENVRIFMPLTSMLLVSVVLSLLVALAKKFM
ncbi:MAG TPA: DUF2905 domain-containing protein [Firmicutes bacterium]|jgi:hypothetical protein|nr:DUF2905 domain-containing protein [Bacillota bacterium]